MTHSHVCHAPSKYSIKIKSHHHVRTYIPILCLESQRNHTHTHIHTHTHRCMWAPPHSLHRLYPLVLLLPANLCVYHIAYVHSPTPVFGEPPPPQAHAKGVLVCMPTTIQTKTKNSNKMYLGLYTRVSTHLIMACSKGTETEISNQTHACIRTKTIQDILAKNSLVFIYDLNRA